ncbi:MAG: protein kinase [Acidobacteriota bacterium]
MIGSLIGNYKILRRLNEAELFGVYKAVDVVLDRCVYIKTLGREHSEQASKKFRFEAEILAKIMHPSVPTLHSLTALNDQLFMILEFLEGETLDKLLRRQGKLSPEKAVSIFTEVLDCLEFTHSAGIAHGDLKTKNIFLTKAGSVKILSFGTSENFHINETDENSLLELDSEIAKFAGRDIYAVGKMLFEVLTGDNLSSDEIGEAAQRLREVNPAIPEKTVEAVANIFRLQTYGRFQSATELRRELAQPVSVTDYLPKDYAVLKNSDFASHPANSSAAVFSIDFSQNENKFKKGVFRRNWRKRRNETKATADAPINWKLAQKNLWVGGAGILAIVVLHFFFQVSFIKNDLAQMEKQLPEIEPINEVKPFAKTEPFVEVEPFAETDPFVKQIDDDETDEPATKTETAAEMKTKKREVLRKPEIVSPPVQPRTRTAPTRTVIKRKEPLETRAERLRRAEKILTGA